MFLFTVSLPTTVMAMRKHWIVKSDASLPIYFPRDAVVYSAMGIRAEESPARAKKEVLTIRKDCTAQTKNRYVYDWLPIHHFTLEDVWSTLLPDGGINLLRWHQRYYQETHTIHPSWEYHPAYVLGNERVSCALCVLASKNDLVIGKEHEPDVYKMIVKLEEMFKNFLNSRKDYMKDEISGGFPEQEFLSPPLISLFPFFLFLFVVILFALGA
jgi:3'-phosphoadenosine 5'-phosphosulfate sulfotransferase (PAPS reductase)/FAD synthetase